MPPADNSARGERKLATYVLSSPSKKIEDNFPPSLEDTLKSDLGVTAELPRTTKFLFTSLHSLGS